MPIGRRAWIGDGRHGASLAPDGTIDWYASGGLTAEPDLWRLLDESGPALRVGPVRDGGGAAHRLPPAAMAYRAGTNVVETIMEAAAGRRVAVVDFVPWPEPGGLVRLVRALAGPVEVEVEVLTGPERRPGGGRREVHPAAGGLLLDGLLIAAPSRFEAAPVDRDTGRWRARLHLEVGEEMVVTVGFDDPVGVDAARRLLADTETAWRSWLAPLAYAGPYRNAVERALLSVRMLTGPGGAPAEAGTTSLPRRVGSERGADDRWVRLRSVARAAEVLAAAGLTEDAEAAETWLRQTVTEADLPWPAWFDADGQPVPEEEERPYEGWRRSQPVVAGRRPVLDLGLVGAVAGAVGASSRGPWGRRGDPGPLSAALDIIGAAVDWAADRWREPDAGRWEIERLRFYTASRVELWRALDRTARLARAANPLDLRAPAWQQEGGDLLSWLESEAVAPDGGLRMAGGGEDEADAALLDVVGDRPWPVTHPVVATTVSRAVARLSSGPLLHRYSDRVADERAGPDLPDLEASFLAVRALAALGRWDAAHERMEGITNLVDGAGPGLLAQTADPVAGELFGNFPDTAAALALVDAAVILEGGPR